MMIIECVNCNKKFSVNSELIPRKGRTIQCGSCNHVWFFDPTIADLTINEKVEPTKNQTVIKKQKIKNKQEEKINTHEKSKKKNFEITEYQAKSSITLINFLSYILVTIISLIALIILIDTFKSLLYEKFPNLEALLFSLFEILKDIKLFIKDLI
tara:strand:- start:35 stop:499 length:465 start_codon:yes stop_codon:yes gene_type:complete